MGQLSRRLQQGAQQAGLLTCIKLAVRFFDIGQSGKVRTRVQCIRQVSNPTGEPMKALSDLFSTSYGLMSVGVIAFTIGMGVYFYRYFNRRIEEDAAAAKRRGE
jgi:heme/copper-type cytochrome/quinol oxidase subunit 2